MRKLRLNDVVEWDSMTPSDLRAKSGRAKAVRNGSWRNWSRILGLEDRCGKSILGEENNVWEDTDKGSRH